MGKPIVGKDYPISGIFSSEFNYFIPEYQRPYAWGIDQTTELFDDLYDFYQQEKEESYFLGSIVLIKEEGKPGAEVIDGQQRLTTLTILLAIIASKLQGELRKDFEGYIKEPGRPSQGLQHKPRVLIRERDQPFFNKYVQEMLFEALIKLGAQHITNESQQNIQANSQILLNKIQSKFGDDGDAIFKFGSFVVSRCYLVAVSTPNRKSAFRIFSVLNNRGLDLLPTDIIKASDIIGKIKDEKKKREYTEKWEEIEVKAGRDGFNDVFVYIRMIFAKAKAKRALLEEFREWVLAKMKSPEDFIDDVLEPYADAYFIVKHQQFKSTQNAQDVNNYIKWLSRIDNSDWMPPAISFLSSNHNDSDYVLWFFKKLERLAAYLHICSKNVNQRIERYAKVLEELEKEHRSGDLSLSIFI